MSSFDEIERIGDLEISVSYDGGKINVIVTDRTDPMFWDGNLTLEQACCLRDGISAAIQLAAPEPNRFPSRSQ